METKKTVVFNHVAKSVPDKNIQKAMKFSLTAQGRKELVASAGAELKSAEEFGFGPAQLEALNARSARIAPERYPLFMAGYSDTIALNKILPKPESCSKMSEEVDIPLIPKLGSQGARFSSDYMLKHVLRYYETPAVEFDVAVLEDDTFRDILEEVATDLESRVGKLIPLTWEEAVYEISKDKACWPYTGQKSDGDVVEWLLAHPYDLGVLPEDTTGDLAPSSLLGQRYQRNKHDDNDMPIPRCIFNADVRFVVAAAMYEIPLVRALQKNAITDHMSPYTELNGPESVGQAISEWYSRKPAMSFESVEIDVKGMDMCFRKIHCDTIIYPILRRLFADNGLINGRDFLWESLQFGFTTPIVVSKDVVLLGDHGHASGVTWIHITESILTRVCHKWAMRNIVIGTLDDSEEITALSSLDRWKPVLDLVAGDDLSKVVAKPVGSVWVEYTGGDDFRECDLLAVVTREYARLGMITAPTKISVRSMYVNFCSKTYSLKNRALSEDGKERYWRPTYSPVMALLNILHPEYDLERPSLACEVLRVAQIVDQTYGHEQHKRLVVTLLNSLSDDDIGRLKSVLANPDGLTAEEKFLGRASAYAWRGGEGWTVGNSPFLMALSAFVGLDKAQRAELRGIDADVVMFRRIHWRYHIRPADVMLDGTVSHDTYTAFFDDTFGRDETTGLRVYNYEALRFGLEHNDAGAPAPARDATRYSPVDSFDVQFDIDDPLAELRSRTVVQSVAYDDKATKRKVKFFGLKK